MLQKFIGPTLLSLTILQVEGKITFPQLARASLSKRSNLSWGAQLWVMVMFILQHAWRQEHIGHTMMDYRMTRVALDHFSNSSQSMMERKP
jgi:hypothetical protein